MRKFKVGDSVKYYNTIDKSWKYTIIINIKDRTDIYGYWCFPNKKPPKWKTWVRDINVFHVEELEKVLYL